VVVVVVEVVVLLVVVGEIVVVVVVGASVEVVVGVDVVVVVVLGVVIVCPASTTFKWSIVVTVPRIVRLSVYTFGLVDRFSPNLNERSTRPDLHLTVVANPATFGDDYQEQVLALWTVAGQVTVPPPESSVRVGTVPEPAALASAGTAHTDSATTAMKDRKAVRKSTPTVPRQA